MISIIELEKYYRHKYQIVLIKIYFKYLVKMYTEIHKL